MDLPIRLTISERFAFTSKLYLTASISRVVQLLDVLCVIKYRPRSNIHPTCIDVKIKILKHEKKNNYTPQKVTNVIT